MLGLASLLATGGTLASLGLGALFSALVLGLLHLRSASDDRWRSSVIDVAGALAGPVSFAAMLTIAAGSILSGHRSVSSALRLWMFALVLLCMARAALWWLERRVGDGRRPVSRTLIVGAGAVGHQVARRLRQDSQLGFIPVGFLDADPMPYVGPSDEPLAPVLGTPDDLAEVAERTGARHVILAFTSAPDQLLVELARRCRELGLGVSVVPRFYEAISGRDALDFVGGLPLLTLDAIRPDGWQFGLKHLVDRLVASLLLVITAPIMVGIAVAVWLGSPGPVLFRQRRVGRDGRVFELYKFRTMVTSAVAGEFVLPDGLAPGGVEGEDRRTAIGRWLRATSLDELPQLFNVLRGEMSLVGPRPERPEFVERFTREVHRYPDRHRVKSGITGWAQVNGLRGQTSIADRVEWDNHYIQNWSLGLELRTLILTIAEVMRFRDSARSAPEASTRPGSTGGAPCTATSRRGTAGAPSTADLATSSPSTE